MAKSFHHRIAKLRYEGDYRPKCQARDCGMAVEYACEYAMMRKGKAVTGAKLYCDNHARRFADRHNIDIAAAPIFSFNDIDKSDRTQWAFSRHLTSISNNDLRNVQL